MLLDGLTSDFIVHKGCHEVLEGRPQLVDYGLVCSFFSLFFQNKIHFDNLLVGVSQIVLTAHRARHRDGRTNRRWSNWQVSYDSPVWSTMTSIEAHNSTVFVRDAFQHCDCLIRPEDLFAISRVVEILISILDVNAQTDSPKLRLFIPTTTLLALTCVNTFRKTGQSLEPSFASPDLQEHESIFSFLLISKLFVLLIFSDFAGQNFRAIEADTLEDLIKIVKHTSVIDWTIKCDVAKMSRTSLHSYQQFQKTVNISIRYKNPLKILDLPALHV